MKISRIALFTGIILTVIVAILLLGSFLRAPTGPITRKEAVEISKTAMLVREGMATYDHSLMGEINYYNYSQVERLQIGHLRDIFIKVPEGHDVWEVGWSFTVAEHVWIGYTVIVIVDAETGAIIHETKGVGYG